MTNIKHNDEIDLIELIKKIKEKTNQVIRKIITYLYSIFLFLIRKSILISIITIIILITGYVRYKNTDRYYTSTLEAYTNAVPSLDMVKYINNLHKMFEENDEKSLMNKLNLNQEQLSILKDIQAYKTIDFNKDGSIDKIDFDNEYELFDTSISRSHFAIKATVYDPSIYSLLQNSLLDYIKKNKYIVDRNTVQINQTIDLISKIESEIVELDSLSQKEYFHENTKLNTQAGQLVILNEKETNLYHNQIISLYKQKQELEKNLLLRGEPLTIYQDFESISFVENNLMSYMKFYFILGLILAIVISKILESINGIKLIVKEAKIKG